MCLRRRAGTECGRPTWLVLCACSVVVPRGARGTRETRRLRAAPGFCRLVAVARPLLGRHGYRAPGRYHLSAQAVRSGRRSSEVYEQKPRIRNSRSNGQRGGHARGRAGGTWHGARSHRPRRKQSQYYSIPTRSPAPSRPGSRPPEPVAHDPALLSVSHTVRRIGSRTHRAHILYTHQRGT